MKKTIKFTIYGNHKISDGNPVPKLKMTRGQSWMPKAQEYKQWKQYVRMVYCEVVPSATFDAIRGEHPIVLLPRQKAEMHLKFYWKDETHGDPENIFGGIADALFKNDKNLYGSMMPGANAPVGKGMVGVELVIYK